MPFVSSVRSNFGPQRNLGRLRIPFGSTGGTITTAGGYRIHTFTNTGNDTFSLLGGDGESVPLEYLVVAGGGAGGDFIGGPGYNMAAGGGGAGGYLTGTLNNSTVGNYTVTVGIGGESTATGPGQSQPLYAKNGNPSVFHTVPTTGGGRGTVGNSGLDAAGPNAYNASPGGSGGGGGRADPTPVLTMSANGGTGVPGQGNPGGNGPNNNGCGGGGAGGSGGPAPGSNGGAGLSSSISGSPLFYAGGGGGGQGWIPDGPHTGSGGSSVGGVGGKKTSSIPIGQGTDAVINRGSGGGGSGSYPDATKSPSTFFQGGNGSPGVVIVRYLI